jgi:mono/diheme cytochrome c family protein
MWKRGLIAAAGVAVLAIAAAGVAQTPAPAAPDAAAATPAPVDAAAGVPPSAPVSPEQALIDKGKYLAIAGDCAACHTKPEGPALAGGVGLNTPFGTIYSPNITPDKKTGIGGWTKEDFERAMRKGKDHTGANLYPAFPYPSYTLVTTADSDAIYAFLMSQPAAENTPPKNGLGFPFNMRILLTPWNWLHFRAGEFQPVAGKSAEWNRGKYLFDGLGHCGGCHTPKNFMGGDKKSQALQGGVLENWLAPDLTGNTRYGLGKWTDADIVAFLKAGSNEHTAVYATMVDVVQNSTSQMTDEDLKAMAVYMKSLAASPMRAAAKPDAAVMAAGKPAYNKQCASCHGDDGKGTPGLYPSLAGGSGVQSPDATSVIHVILSGNQPGPHTTIVSPDPMPAFAAKLKDADVAAIATYVRNSWGNVAAPVTAEQVAKLRKKVVVAAAPAALATKP